MYSPTATGDVGERLLAIRLMSRVSSTGVPAVPVPVSAMSKDASSASLDRRWIVARRWPKVAGVNVTFSVALPPADTVVTLVPYFKVRPGQLAAFLADVPVGDLLVAVNAGGGSERLTFNLGAGVNLREVARSSGAAGSGDPTTGVDLPARTAIIWEVVP